MAMGMAYDCQLWKNWKLALGRAKAIKNFEVVDQMEAALTRIAKQIAADPRRVDAVKDGCPDIWNEIEQRMGSAPRRIADPMQDPAHLETWLKSLAAEDLTELMDAAKAEAANRKKAQSKKR